MSSPIHINQLEKKLIEKEEALTGLIYLQCTHEYLDGDTFTDTIKELLEQIYVTRDELSGARSKSQ